MSQALIPAHALLKRLHFYIGIVIGPFVLVAALSGVVYALTPQLENYLYQDALHTSSTGTPLSLEAQIRAAQSRTGTDVPVTAVRPAPAQGDTTRVMFSAPGLGASEYRAVFIDPVTAQIRGDMTVYGTSGVLPLRTWLDQFHRGLMLGDVGRLYSELAASWLWVAAVGGLILWFARRRKRGINASRQRVKGLRQWHATLGLVLLIGLLFFSATGLTWSKWAGGNIGVLRAQWGWATPSVSTALGTHAMMTMPMDEHAEHHMMHMTTAQPATEQPMSLFDDVLKTARAHGIDAAKVEIRPSSQPDKAWTVTEVDRSWPTQVDAVAIDAHDLRVVDKVEFASYPLAAKLTRWGIDAHMGALFGLVNQLVLVAFASGLAVMVVMGYLMWWRRRPTRSMGLNQQPTLLDAWRSMTWAGRGLGIAVALLLGMALPVLGWSLLALIAWDMALSASAARRLTTHVQP
ncbi:PepSY-associated TM helix domain-containing protein [Pseudomonas luteola]|uniref:PepSY-associated TM helix domain-containing protein n=1 Tax=Pseudomonas luteola TaxID=47886 RepID=UPI003A89493A